MFFEGVPKSPNNVHSTVLRKPDGYHIMHSGFWFNNVNTIGPGASFGEVAIMGKNMATRNATIFCKSDCVFAVLDKDNFQRIIGEHQKRITHKKMNFLKKVAIFKELLDDELETMIYFLKPQNYAFRDVIFKQGSDIDEVFIIKQGKVKVSTAPFRGNQG